MKRRGIVIVAFLLLSFGLTLAEPFRIIGAGDLRGMMDAKKKMVVVDTRTPQEFSQGHIERAINIPPEKVPTIASLLPKDKAVPLVFYCRGAG